MDVHKETISIGVMNSAGKLVIESILETEAMTLLQFVQGLRGNLQVTDESELDKRNKGREVVANRIVRVEGP